MAYRIEFQASAGRELKALPKDVRVRVDRAVLALGENPRHAGVIKLAGGADLFRVRVGNYRIVFTIRDAILVVLVVRIAHRRDAYR